MANKERQFKVLVIAISLKNNKIAHSKDVIDESQFSAPIADLVSGGYIEEFTGEEKEVSKDVIDESQLNDSDLVDEKDEPADLSDIENSIPGGNKPNQKKK